MIRNKMARVLCAALLALLLAGCAGLGKNETPQSMGAKNLLSVRQGIIAAAETANALCAQGIMKQDACDKALKIYVDAQYTYVAASDAFLLYLTAKDDASRQKYEAINARLMAVFTDLDTLIKIYGGAK